MDKQIFERIENFAKKKLEGSSHGWDHTQRVYNLSLKLAENKKVDLDVLKIAVLLHDIERQKEDENKTDLICHAEEAAKTTSKFLKGLNFSENKINEIVHCIETHRYRNNKIPKSIEAKILFDADKLDSIGAVGIARGFLWAGEHNSKIHKEITDINEYKKLNIGKNGRIKNSRLHTPYIEFLLKLRGVKDNLLTEEAKKFAYNRYIFMKKFYDEFHSELEGAK